MGKRPAAREAVLRLHRVDDAEHLRFLEVEGELRQAASTRWSGLLRGLVEEHAEGLVVDLRGCRAIDEHCLETLLAAGATLKGRGGAGVVLVALPGSALARRLRRRAGELVTYDSARAAMKAFGTRRMPRRTLIRLYLEGGLAIITVSGDFDLARSDDFRAAVTEGLALKTDGVVIDLEHCEFIDSTGIGLLMRSFELAGRRDFALAASPPQVHRALELADIPSYLPTYDTREEAVSALNEGRAGR